MLVFENISFAWITTKELKHKCVTEIKKNNNIFYSIWAFLTAGIISASCDTFMQEISCELVPLIFL